MPVSALDPTQDPRWPALLRRHPSASVFHTQSWLESLRRTYGYQPIAYTTAAPDGELRNVVVTCVVRSWLTGERLVSLPFSDHAAPLIEDTNALAEILRFLTTEQTRRRWKYVELRPPTDVANLPSGFGRSREFVFHRIDLRPPLELLYDRFHKDCVQRKIRRAEREHLTYQAGRSDDFLRQFYRLLVMTCRRKVLPPQPLNWFRNLASVFGDALTIHIALKGSRPVASILTLDFKDSLVYKYGCSDTAAYPLGGMHMLLWTAIQDAKRRGRIELDLGRSDGDHHGLIAFKDRWGASRVVSNYLRYPSIRSRKRPGDRTLQLARKAFARMPDKMLIAVGSALYRHAG